MVACSEEFPFVRDLVWLCIGARAIVQWWKSGVVLLLVAVCVWGGGSTEEWLVWVNQPDCHVSSDMS